jgi:wyosine [tRNA(Phe)-imidazoG37] synthetase (radical SAM superfamily)
MNVHITHHIRDVAYSPLFGNCMEINLSSSKTCPFDCIYCPHGPTMHKSIDRINFIPVLDTRELARRILSAPLPLDNVVIAGLGDPAIYSPISPLIKNIKSLKIAPVAVISCGGLLWRRDVQKDLIGADIVVATLDVTNKILFQRVNKPAAQVAFDRYINGLAAFSRVFRGELWLQVHFIDGINTSEAEMTRLAYFMRHIKPEKAFLTTIPSLMTDTACQSVSDERLYQFAHYFDSIDVSVISLTDYKSVLI